MKHQYHIALLLLVTTSQVITPYCLSSSNDGDLPMTTISSDPIDQTDNMLEQLFPDCYNELASRLKSCSDTQLIELYHDLIDALNTQGQFKGGILSSYPALQAAVVRIRSHLYCNAPAQFTGPVKISGETVINGEVTIGGPLNVTSLKPSIFANDLTVEGNLVVLGTLDAHSSGTVDSTVNFTGSLSGDVTGTQTATVLSQVSSLAGSAGVVHNNNAGVLSSSLVVNADVDPAAAIAYSKLNLTNSIVNADINTSAAIAYSKLNLANAITNNDVSSSAAIAYSKLNLTNSIVNADINTAAAIADTKLATISTSGKVANSATSATSSNTPNTIVSRDGSGNFSAQTITLSGNLNIPISTSSTVGCITANTFPILHTFNGNIALGLNALNFSTTGLNNIALGFGTLTSLTSGENNIAAGQGALGSVTSGSDNVALGGLALSKISSSVSNTGIGVNAGANLATGDRNTLIGPNAGIALLNGSDNIYIGSLGSGTESNTIRIGGGQTRFFGSGIYGTTTGSTTTLPVIVADNGQLGTAASSIRFKENVHDVSPATLDKLAMLRPVSFTYKHDTQKHTEYGLIAEEVHEIMPELVAHDNDGNIYTVRYQLLPPLLLAALQQQEKVLVDLERQLAVLKHDLHK